jgi:hypothetical protein
MMFYVATNLLFIHRTTNFYLMLCGMSISWRGFYAATKLFFIHSTTNLHAMWHQKPLCVF